MQQDAWCRQSAHSDGTHLTRFHKRLGEKGDVLRVLVVDEAHRFLNTLQDHHCGELSSSGMTTVVPPLIAVLYVCFSGSTGSRAGALMTIVLNDFVLRGHFSEGASDLVGLELLVQRH